MKGYLLDSSVVIDWLRGRPPVTDWLESQARHRIKLAVTPITVAEVLAGVDPSQRASVATWLQQFAWASIGFNAARRAAELYWDHSRAGSRLPLPDLIQAAVALDLGLAVATSNLRHFPDVRTVNPREAG
jgi:predicted nucleic acid-binding protein